MDPKDSNSGCTAPLPRDPLGGCCQTVHLEGLSNLLYATIAREMRQSMEMREVFIRIVKQGNIDVLRRAIWEGVPIEGMKEVVESIAATVVLPPGAEGISLNKENASTKRKNLGESSNPTYPGDFPAAMFSPNFQYAEDFFPEFDYNVEMMRNLRVTKKPRNIIPSDICCYISD